MTKFKFLLFFGLNSKIFSVSQICLSSASNLGSHEVASSFAENCGCKRPRSRTPTYLKLRRFFGRNRARPAYYSPHCAQKGVSADSDRYGLTHRELKEH